MNILVFDIETIPDLETGRRLYSLTDLSDEDTAKALFAIRRMKVGHDFLAHHMQKIVAISLVLKTPSQLTVWSLGEEHSEESELIKRFFGGIDKHVPTLVSWNGSGFDLPVLHYRALYHGIQAPTYWEIGEQHSAFKWNNYLNRFHVRHLDLMDLLAGYQNKAFAPLDEIATLLCFPGKMGMSGNHVWDHFQAGKLKEIRDYCETDVLNTYCIYLRFELMRGTINSNEYRTAFEQLKNYLNNESDRPHLQTFAAQLD